MLSARHVFEAIGTSWSIDTARPLSQTEILAIDTIMADFDAAYSRFRDDSLVSKARRASPGTFEFPASIEALFDTYSALSRATGGRVNPLVGTSLEQLGYDARYSLKPLVAQPAPEFHTITRRGVRLTFSEKSLLDIGAVGKGYLVDTIASTLAASHDEYVVDGSGDVAIRAHTPERIGLEHPLDTTRVIGVIRLSSGSLCASAINRRAWSENLHHIIDATTGKPTASDIIATWAIAESTLTADALTTGLFFAAPGQLQQTFGDFHYAIMKKDGSVIHNITSAIGEIFV